MREGSVNDFTNEELFTLSSNTPQQLETCLFILGKDEIDSTKAQVIWTVLKQIYGSVSDIPEESLRKLGWIISGIPADDFYNITISDVDMVSSFGLYRNLSIHQLTALKLSTENQWGRKTADQLTSYDLSALKQILCAFNESEIASIHPDSYRDAASELSTLQKCPKSTLNQLITLATDETAFGRPSNWNAIQVTSIGCVMNGLSSAHEIPSESMEGITPQIVKCLSPSFLQTMSERQLQHFTTNAASSLSSTQRDVLSSDQRYALEQAVIGLRYAKRSSAHHFSGVNDVLCDSINTSYLYSHVISQKFENCGCIQFEFWPARHNKQLTVVQRYAVMINVPHFIFIGVLLSHLGQTLAAQNCSDVKLDPSSSPGELLAYLTHPCFYDKHTSPLHGFNKSETDRINFKLHVYYFKQKPGPSLIRWNDPRLRYKHKISTIPKISGEHQILHQIWLPHIYLASERSSLIRGKLNKDIAVHILPDGTVLYTSRLITEISCWVKLGKFPLDKQKCHLTIDTWKFQSGDLKLKWENDTAVTISQEASFLAEYRLTDTIFFTDFQFSEPDHIGGHQYNCSSLTVVFYVSRNYGFYLMNYYVPSVLLVVISWVSFWEAPDALPGRTLLGTGTMLTFMTLGVEVSKSLPTVPYIRSNDLWFFGCTAFIFCSLAEFAFVNTLWRYGGEVELKKATSKYILKSSLGAKAPETMRFGRRRSLSCPSSPTTRWENPLKRVVNNELTVKSLSDLEISLPLSELKTRRKETFEITEKPPDPPTTMKMQEIAVWIDKKSRLVFPICFSIFSCVYWTLLLVS